jgi:hypothetical protein
LFKWWEARMGCVSVYLCTFGGDARKQYVDPFIDWDPRAQQSLH